MASTATSIAAILAAVALVILGAPASPNNEHTPSINSLPRPLDVHVLFVKDGEYKLVVKAEPDVTDVTTTVSLNKVVTEVSDGVEVLQLTKKPEGDEWISPPIRAKLDNKDVLHLGVHFFQEGKKEMQSVNYFEMNLFDAMDKLNAIKDLKPSPLLKETTRNIKKRDTASNPDNGQADDMIVSMTMITDEEGEPISDRWGAHGGGHNHRGAYHGNSDFVQIPFLPVKVPTPVDSAFGLLSGFFGGGNRDRDDGHHRHRPGPSNRPNNDWDMDDDRHGGRGNGNGWGNGGMNDWGHNHGNNGRWPDRHRPHHGNCHHRDGSDENSDDDSGERPRPTMRPRPTIRPRPTTTTRRSGPQTRWPSWTSPTTPTTTRYSTRTTTPTTTSTTTPTTTTEQVYDIDIRFGQNQPTTVAENADPKPDSDKELPAAV